MLPKCPGSLFGHHRFEARYDERSYMPSNLKMDSEPGKGIPLQFFEVAKTHEKTYRGDVCVRCGEVVNFEHN